MDSKTTIQHNKLMQLENSMLMYGIYNAEMLEKLINTVHYIYNITCSHVRLFAGQQCSLTLRSLYANTLGLQHYSINSLLYLRTVQDKYITLYRKLITQLCIYTTSIRILANTELEFIIAYSCHVHPDNLITCNLTLTCVYSFHSKNIVPQ